MGRNARARGQALAEFALVAALLVMLVVTTLSIVPAITVRGVVLDAAANAVERTARYLAPTNESLTVQRTILCNALLGSVRVELARAGYPVTTGQDGCRDRAGLDATHNPVVTAIPDTGVTDLVPSPSDPVRTRVRICVVYRYDFPGGLLFLLSRAPGDVGASLIRAATYSYCGWSVIDAKRTR
jgi:hypothetical protein